MTSIGETLRRERLSRNIDLEQISQELKISSRFLEAIEDEKFDRLPGGVFARSFVRQYARFLDLDDEELAAQVQRLTQPEPVAHNINQDNGEPSIHVPRVEAWQGTGESRIAWTSWVPAAAMVVIVVLACSGFYSWWQRERHTATAQATADRSAETTTPAPAVQPPAPTTSVAAQPPAAQPEPQFSNPNAPVRVAMTAEEPVWVSVRVDGKYLFSGTLEPSQTRLVEANDKLVLRLGNAGGIAITLNGKPIGTVGPKGQPRTLQFTSGGFQIVAEPKPSLPLDAL